ncbi:MAG: FlgD immunoglobulin-like domain containing protein [bacterium]
MDIVRIARRCDIAILLLAAVTFFLRVGYASPVFAQDTALQCEIEVLSPAKGALICEDSVKVTAVVRVEGGTHPFTIDCTINGFSADVADDSVLCATIPLTVGLNLIQIACTVTDAQGNQTSCDNSRNLTLVNRAGPPACFAEISSPLDSAFVCGDSVKVTGMLNIIAGVPPFDRFCEVNGVVATVTDSMFMATVPLEPGKENSIIAVCTVVDSCGNEAVCTDTIVVEVPPAPVCTVEITVPQDSAIICGDNVTVAGTTVIKQGVPPFTINCEVNGVGTSATPIVTSDRTVDFMTTVPFPFSDNLIIATCTVTDSCGIQTVCADTLHVFRPPAPICVTEITSPQDSSVICGDSLSVQGLTTITAGFGPFSVVCEVNGVPAQVDENRNFIASVPFPFADSLIIAVCTIVDSCGTQTVCTDTVRAQPPPPPACLVDILSPSNGARIDADSVKVTAVTTVTSGTPPFTITSAINGVISDVSQITTRDSTITFMATVPCDSLIIAVCTIVDSCGNETICSDTVRVQCRPEECILFGVDGDTDELIKLDLSTLNPAVEILGPITDGSATLVDLECMTWDPFTKRMLVIVNEDEGGLYEIDPKNIPTAPPADIPATLIGNTGLDDIEGLAINPVTSELFGVDNVLHKFLQINRTTGEVTMIGELGFKDVEGLAFTLESNPTLFGADTRTGQIITINTSTGAGTAVSADSVGFPNVECLEFCPDGNLIGFSNGHTQTIHTFLSIDPGTGIGTRIPTRGAENLDIEGLAFLMPDTMFARLNPQVTEEKGQTPLLPGNFALRQNYPNPFNPTTQIVFTIPESFPGGVQVQLRVYNLLGHLVKTLASGHTLPGSHTIEWDGRSQNGEAVSSGIYLYQLVAGEFKLTRRMLLLK